MHGAGRAKCCLYDIARWERFTQLVSAVRASGLPSIEGLLVWRQLIRVSRNKNPRTKAGVLAVSANSHEYSVLDSPQCLCFRHHVLHREAELLQANTARSGSAEAVDRHGIAIKA